MNGQGIGDALRTYQRVFMAQDSGTCAEALSHTPILLSNTRANSRSYVNVSNPWHVEAQDGKRWRSRTRRKS